jgi:hypothetical protein
MAKGERLSELINSSTYQLIHFVLTSEVYPSNDVLMANGKWPTAFRTYKLIHLSTHTLLPWALSKGYP